MNIAGSLIALTLLLSLARAQEIRSWTTTADLNRTLREERLTWAGSEATDVTAITIDPKRTFQPILGLGASFEHTTCSNLARMPAAERDRAIAELVASNGAGMNLMRVCIGTSDFCGEDWYSYDDLPPAETDPDLLHFSIGRDRDYILPVLRRARELNPYLLYFASPWSPPGWMKTSGNMIGGELLPKYYGVYAQYFVRFIQAYADEGIPIYAVTVQNEPGVDRSKDKPSGQYPSCHWTGEQERDFIRDHLGPALRKAGLKTRIWCYDHNYNAAPAGDSAGLGHARTILRDRNAAAFVDGTAFHHYEGQPSGMSIFHDEFPDKPIHFSEGSVFSIYGGHDLIERLRNWAESYNAWVSILDEAGKPNRGPFPATIAILRFNSKTGKCEKLLEFYNYAHFSKFIQRGARRIESTTGSVELNNIAFLNPDGSIVVILVNTTGSARPVTLRSGGQAVRLEMAAQSIRTLQWTPSQ